jgi:hypothetical protein
VLFYSLLELEENRLLAPTATIITNMIICSFGLIYNDKDRVIAAVQLFLFNATPGMSIIIYFILRERLLRIKKDGERVESQNRESLEKWLSSLKEHANNLQIHFFTYTVDGKLAGKIIAKY